MKWVTALLPLLLCSSCFAPKAIQQEQALFQQHIKHHPSLRKQTLVIDENRLFYASNGDIQKPALIIIHGTPGNWQQYARYMLNEQLLKSVQVIVIDRPGWGHSTLSGGKQIASFGEQAAMIATLAKQLKQDNDNQAVILMGHSLGASIAPRVVMDFPQAVDGLLLLAGALDPELSGPRWYNRAADIPGIHWLIGDNLRKSNDEVMALRQEMRTMEPRWSDVNAYITVVQGMKDKLVYPANIDFAERNLNPETSEIIRLDQDGHLFPMTRRKDVVHWSECLLQKMANQTNNCVE